MSGAVIFPSVEFALFFPLVLGLSWLLMPRPRLWKPFVLVASYAFYMAASWKFGVLLGVVTLGNQLAAVWLAHVSGARARKSVVTLAIVLDLGVLAAFKYYGFFAQEINGVLGDFGLALSMPLVAIAIPLGVSFYVFQAISYVVDVYRGVIERGSTIDVAIYLSFFPHVVAGPIVRAREFLPQLERPRDPRDVAVGAAVVLIAVGPGQEGGDRRHARARGRRPGVRGPRGLCRAGRLAGGVRLRGPDLLRLLRLHRHRDRRRAADGLRVPAELPRARIARPRSASSGAAGTSRCRASCATSSTSRSAATAAGAWRRRAT